MRFIATTFCLAFLVTSSLFAISVKMPKDYLDIKNERSSSFVIVNPSESFKAVEVEVFLRSHSVTGNEERKLTEDFMVIPPQLIIGPRQERVCTLQWLGTTQPAQEIAYRIVVEEVPFNKERANKSSKADGAVTLRIRFVNSFYVRPPDIKPNIVAQTVEPVGNKMKIHVQNIGSEHRIVHQFTLQLDTGETVEVDQTGNPLNILAGEKREIEMDWPETLEKKSYQASIKKI